MVVQDLFCYSGDGDACGMRTHFQTRWASGRWRVIAVLQRIRVWYEYRADVPNEEGGVGCEGEPITEGSSRARGINLDK